MRESRVNLDVKLRILSYLTKRPTELVPLKSIPNANLAVMEALLKEGLIGVERVGNGKINCIITTRGCRFVQENIIQD